MRELPKKPDWVREAEISKAWVQGYSDRETYTKAVKLRTMLDTRVDVQLEPEKAQGGTSLARVLMSGGPLSEPIEFRVDYIDLRGLHHALTLFLGGAMTEPWKDRIFTNSGPLPLRSENPDDGYSAEDLVPHGWAPGGYMGRCQDCKEVHVGCDKRCRRCRPCAVTSLKAYRNRPTWQTSHRGLPTDRDVWAWRYSPDTGAVELQRGRDVDGDFMVAGEEWWAAYGVGNVICWIDGEECPELSVEAVGAIVASLPDLSGCLDHIVEDWLHWFALQAVVDGHRDAPAIAAAALKSRDLKFSRYYG